MLKGVYANQNPIQIQEYTFIMASGQMAKGGANRNPKQNPNIAFYSGFRKNTQGGVKFEILKMPGIDRLV